MQQLELADCHRLARWIDRLSGGRCLNARSPKLRDQARELAARVLRDLTVDTEAYGTGDLDSGVRIPLPLLMELRLQEVASERSTLSVRSYPAWLCPCEREPLPVSIWRMSRAGVEPTLRLVAHRLLVSPVGIPAGYGVSFQNVDSRLVVWALRRSHENVSHEFLTAPQRYAGVRLDSAFYYRLAAVLDAYSEVKSRAMDQLASDLQDLPWTFVSARCRARTGAEPVSTSR